MKPSRVAAVLAVLAVPLAVSQLPPVRAALLSLVVFMRVGGPRAVLAYALTYCVAALFATPVALFSAMAGYAWGMPRALLFASPAAALAASCAFFSGRYLLRGPISRRVADNPEWKRIDRALTHDPLRIALLLRATPLIPQNFLSYGLSLSRISYRHFALATLVGGFPAVAVQAYVGSLVHDATELVQGGATSHGALRWALPALGLAVSVITAVITARLARAALERALAAEEATATPPDRGLQS